MNLSDSARHCPFCTRTFHEQNRGGESWFGDDICEACANTFAQCHNCGRHMLAHEETEDNSGEPICPECLTKVTYCDHCQKPVPNDGWAGSHLQRGPGLRDYLRCPRCVGGSNRTKVRKHPSTLGAEELDREAAARIAGDA